ncbi:E1/E4 protein [Human papillomavirus type 211]|uniref:E1/E4 protein n=1 Tax=Human papillomavirus type 211 TaxID=2060135 RepID=A0A2H4V8D0_9PAPI|nr:E1/E4 protein [Human papillomavirus type 211]
MADPKALQNGPQSLTKGNGTSLHHPPPGTPRLPRRASLSDDLRGRLFPPRKTLTFDLDEEDNKENYPPQQKEDDYNLSFLLTQLLEKLEHDIDLLLERVSQDFSNFKEKLGIRRS